MTERQAWLELARLRIQALLQRDAGTPGRLAVGRLSSGGAAMTKGWPADYKNCGGNRMHRSDCLALAAERAVDNADCATQIRLSEEQRETFIANFLPALSRAAREALERAAEKAQAVARSYAQQEMQSRYVVGANAAGHEIAAAIRALSAYDAVKRDPAAGAQARSYASRAEPPRPRARQLAARRGT